MWAFFAWLWNGLKSVAALVLPVAGGARRFGSPVLRWTLRILLLVLLCVGLYFLNEWLEVATFVPRPYPWVGKLYLPILGLLVLGWVWLGWYLWRLLNEPVESDFPDIDAAWAEATAALADENVDLTRTPIFLVLGRPRGGESALLEAAVAPSNRPIRVRGVPRGGPLRVYANDDGVYVTCAKASVLGGLAGLLERAGVALPAAASPSLAGPAASARPRTIFETMRAGGNMGKVQELLRETGGARGELSDEQKSKIRELLGGGAMSFAVPAGPGVAPSLGRDEAELEEDAARLEHLCRLIARQRQPDLPLAGILALVPWAASATDEAAAAAAEACRRDLAAARPALRVNCPVVAMVCDLETAPGFRELLSNFRPDRRRTGRIGRKFPLIPDLAGRSSAAEVYASGLAWFCTAEFPTWIYEFFALEQAETDRLEPTIDGNVRLYQILAQLLERHGRISRILHPLLNNESDEPALFGGCYLSATGNKPDHDQAFIAAVFHRLIEEHKNASWSAEAVREDVRDRSRGMWGLVVAGVLLVALVAGVIYGWTFLQPW